jgi:protein SCO1/2
MPNLTRRNVLAIPAVAPAVGLYYAHSATVGLADGPDPTSTPEQLAVRKKLQERYFPNVPLITQDGKKVRFYDDLVKNKIVVISIFYAHCEEACPRINRNLAKAQELLGERMGREVFFNSITIKPEQDTPHELKKYAKTFHAGPGWTFVTGNPDDIELLRRSLRFVDPDPVRDKDKARHSGMLRVGNEPYTIWSMAQAQAKPDAIAEAVKGTMIGPTLATGTAFGPACKAATKS